jgi:hypothetical protein
MGPLMEKLFLLDKIEHGEKQLAEGKGISHEEAKERLKKMARIIWTPKALDDTDLLPTNKIRHPTL